MKNRSVKIDFLRNLKIGLFPFALSIARSAMYRRVNKNSRSWFDKFAAQTLTTNGSLKKLILGFGRNLMLFKLSGLLLLSSYIHSMDQEPFVSSSSSPSTQSGALTFEQREKEEEESKRTQEEGFEIISREEIGEELDWYCQCKFETTNRELDWTNGLKSLMGKKQTNYDNIKLCELDNGKLGVLYTATKFYTIRILDTNFGNCLHIINPLIDEKDPKLIPTQLCLLPQNRIACILNSSENKKIKIYDINSGKFLNEIIIENKYFENIPKWHDSIQGIYLSDNRMALIVKDLCTYGSRLILILDLTSGEIVKKIDLIKKHDCDIFKEKTTSLVKYIDIFGNDTGGQAEVTINQALPFSDGRLLLRSFNNICIISTAGEVDGIRKGDGLDILVLPNGQLLSLNHDNVFKIWDNEKFKFKTIQDVFHKETPMIPDLQKIVLDYLPSNWISTIIIDKIESVCDRKFILDESHILVFYHFFSSIYGCCGVFNVKTGKIKKINLKQDFCLKMYDEEKCKILDNGKRIAFYAKDGSIEIWTNQSRISKEKSEMTA